MTLRCQKLLDSSTHIFNLILWMPQFRGKLVLLSCYVQSFFFAIGRREVSYVRFDWKGRAFVFSVKCKTCPF